MELENDQLLCMALIIAGLLVAMYLFQFVQDKKMLAGLSKTEHFVQETKNTRSAGGVAGSNKTMPNAGAVGPATLADQLYGVNEISTSGM